MLHACHIQQYKFKAIQFKLYDHRALTSIPVPTSGYLTWPPPPLHPFSFPPSSTCAHLVSLLQQMMNATVLAESSISYFIFSPGSLHYGDVYRCESGKCHTLLLFLTIFMNSNRVLETLQNHNSINI